IEHVLAKKLGADMGYVGLITKNPVHRDWWTIWHNHEPHSRTLSNTVTLRPSPLASLPLRRL
ncbi:replication initiation protein, partial [Aeromonas caviae]|uniref:replication initiation protein n=1 Tax=Aeromonas caviae TaxID=648 RepID=UPI001CC5F9D2